MRHGLILLALPLLAGCERAPQVTFATTEITLPADQLELPPGPGMEVVAENCIACHSPSMMFQQPPLARDKWQGIVTKMIEVYKAPIDQEAVPVIVDYLVATQDAQNKANGSAPR